MREPPHPEHNTFATAKRPQPASDPLELQPFGWCPGGYMAQCWTCNAMHTDTDKRSSRCQDCARAAKKDHDAMPKPFKPEPKAIDEMWAWICTEPDGGEGIPALQGPDGPMPMIGADRARIESLRPWAASVANELGLPVRLVRFTGMEVLDRIEPAIKAGRV